MMYFSWQSVAPAHSLHPFFGVGGGGILGDRRQTVLIAKANKNTKCRLAPRGDVDPFYFLHPNCPYQVILTGIC